MNQKEIWRDVKNYEGSYQVSNLGRVKSLKFGKEKIRKLYLNSRGYYQLTLCINSGSSVCRVHQLVAMAFLNNTPCGINSLVVDHIDNNPSNNNLNNLQLLTNRENCNKDKKLGTSEYIGVHLCSSTGRWIARIQIDGKNIWLGRHNTEEEASEIYNNKLKTIL